MALKGCQATQALTGWNVSSVGCGRLMVALGIRRLLCLGSGQPECCKHFDWPLHFIRSHNNQILNSNIAALFV